MAESIWDQSRKVELFGPESAGRKPDYEHATQGYETVDPNRDYSAYAKLPALEVARRAAVNMPDSIVRNAKASGEPFLPQNWISTASTMKDVGLGAASKVEGFWNKHQNPEDKARTEAVVNALGTLYKKRYGDPGTRAYTMSEDPFAFASDIGAVASLGSGAPGVVGKGLGAVAGASTPVSAALKIASAGAKAVAGQRVFTKAGKFTPQARAAIREALPDNDMRYTLMADPAYRNAVEKTFNEKGISAAAAREAHLRMQGVDPADIPRSAVTGAPPKAKRPPGTARKLLSRFVNPVSVGQAFNLGTHALGVPWLGMIGSPLITHAGDEIAHAATGVSKGATGAPKNLPLGDTVARTLDATGNALQTPARVGVLASTAKDAQDQGEQYTYEPMPDGILDSASAPLPAEELTYEPLPEDILSEQPTQLITGAVPGRYTGGRTGRASGGRVVNIAHGAKQLLSKAERAIKTQKEATKPLLAAPDEVVATALRVASEAAA